MRILKTLTLLLSLIVICGSLPVISAGMCPVKYYPQTIDKLEGTSWVNDDYMVAIDFKKGGIAEMEFAGEIETLHYRVDGSTVVFTQNDGKSFNATIDGNKMTYTMRNGDRRVLTKM